MTARKSTRPRKKTTRRKAPRGALARLEAELPRNLRDFRKRVSTQLGTLEKEVERAGVQTRRRAARLIRDASHQLGRLEARGEPGFRKLTAPYRKELTRLLRRLERAVAPPARRKKTARKKTTRKKATRRRA